MHGIFGRVAGTQRMGWGHTAVLAALLAVFAAALPAAGQHFYGAAANALYVAPSPSKNAGASNTLKAIREEIPDATLLAADWTGGLVVEFDSSQGAKRAESKAAAVAKQGFTVEGIGWANQDRDIEDAIFFSDRVVVRVAPGASIDKLASEHGLELLGAAIPELPGTYLLSSGPGAFLEAQEDARALDAHDSVLYARQVTRGGHAFAYAPNDPIYVEQWHLNNVGQAPSYLPGYDVNAEAAWDMVTGAGVSIMVVDTGVDMDHPDLSPNIPEGVGLDLVGEDDYPDPGSGSSHGTSCAGVAAAVGDNGIGVTGAAYNASIIPVRFNLSVVQAVAAFLYRLTGAAPLVDVSTNSYGKNGAAYPEYRASDPLVTDALAEGAATGRGGLGACYLFAAGNYRLDLDTAMHGDYVRDRRVISVAATDARGVYSWYSNPGANNFVCAPSNYVIDYPVNTRSWGITTTTIDGYTDEFGGTSSATPLVAGVVALMLEANPGLTWRDVQHILAETAWQNDAENPFWQRNGAGYMYSPDYGFGTVDAEAAVTTAMNWQNVGPYEMLGPFEAAGLPAAIPDNTPGGIMSSTVVNTPAAFNIEHVEVTVAATHDRLNVNDLQITLISPNGTEVNLEKPLPQYRNYYFPYVFDVYGYAVRFPDVEEYPPPPPPEFMTVAFWGEDPSGEWTLQVEDLKSGIEGDLLSWELRIYGSGAAAGADWGVEPLGGAEFSGPELGPYAPETFTYTLQNDGEAFAYSLDISEPWLSLDSGDQTGTIPAQDSQSFELFVNAEANNLPLGVYRATLLFTNEDTGETARRFATLEITEASPTRPDLTGVLIAPVNPQTSDELTLVYEYFDPNGDPQAAAEIQWLLDGEAYAGAANSATLMPSQTRAGDLWIALVRVQDASGEWSRWVQATPTLVANSAPTIEDLDNVLFRQPDSGGPEGNVLSFLVSASDPDNDPLLNRPDETKQDDALDPLTYSVSIVGDPANAVIDPDSGEFTWDTTGAVAGAYAATFTVEDSAGASDEERITITVEAPCPNPAAPSNIAASDGAYDDRVEVTWDPVEGATAYRVYRALSASSSAPDLMGTVTGAAFDDFSAAAKQITAPNMGCPENPAGRTTYYYWVAAVNACGEGELGGPDSGYAGSGGVIAAGDGLLLAFLAAGLLGAARRYRKQRRP